MTEDVSAGRLHLDAYIDTSGITRGLQRKLDAETARIRARIKAEIDTRGTVASARKAAQEASKAAKVRLQVELNTRGTLAQARALAAQISQQVRVQLRAEVDQKSVAAARAQMSAIGSDTTSTVEVDADTAKAEAQIDTAARDRKTNIKADVDDGGSFAKMANDAGTAFLGASKIPMLVGGFYTLGAAVVQVAGGLVAMTSAASQAVGTLAVLPNLIGVAGQGIAALMIGFHGVGDALGAMGKAQAAAAAQAPKVGRAQVSMANQIRSAQQALNNAEWNQARAHEAAKQAQVDLSKARVEAAKHIVDLDRALRRAIVDESGAINTLKDAKEHLQDVKWDTSATDKEKRDAEQAVKDAEQSLTDARDKRNDLAKEDADANKKGVEGSDVVIAAKKKIRDANHAAQQSDIALANAQRALAQAHKQTGIEAAKTSAATTALQTAMDRLSPAAQRFVRFLYGLKPQWEALRNAVQEALLPPIQRGITAALPMLATLRGGLVDTATRIGSLAERLGTMLGRQNFRNDVSSIMDENNKALTRFGNAGLNLIRILRDIAVVAGPTLLRPFSKWVEKVTDGWAATVKANRANGSMANFFKRAADRAAQLGDIIGNIAGALYGIGKAAIPTGDDLLTTFQNITQGWQDFANSDEGQKKMQDFFAAVKPVTEEFGTLIANLSEFLTKAGGADSSPLMNLLQTLNWIFDGLNKAMENPAVGKFVGWLMAIAGVGGALGMVAGGILKVAGNIGKIGKLASGIGKITGVNKLARSLWGTSEASGPAQRGLGKVKDAAVRAGKAAVGGARNFASWGWTKFKDGARNAGNALAEVGRKGARMAADLAKKGASALAQGARAAGSMAANLARTAAQYARVAAQAAIATAKLVAQRAVMLAVAAGQRAMALAQWAINAAMNANPIGLVVAALALLVGGVILAYQHFSWFRAGVDAVWGAIKAGAAWVWNFISKNWPLILTMLTGPIGLAAAFIIKHWDNIKGGIKAAYENVIKPIIDRFKGAFSALGGMAQWLWDKGIKPAWNSIKDAIDNGWKNIIKPPLQKFHDFIHDTLPGAFETAKTAIGTTWDKIKGLAKTPVKFIVDTVYNDGIRKVINAIPGLPGDLPEISTKGWKSGGVLPGYTPGRDVHRFISATGGALDLSGGEAIMRPEWARLMGGPEAVNLLNAAARKGRRALAAAFQRLLGARGDIGVNSASRPQFATGGVLGLARRAVQRFASGGVIDADIIDSALGFARAQVGKPYVWSAVGPGGYDCSGFMSAITNTLLGKNPYVRVGATASFPWSMFKSGVGQFTIGSTKNYGGSGVGHMAGTLTGTNVESRGGVGPIVGPAARGYNDSGFTTVAHLGAGGKAAASSGGLFAAVKAFKNFVGHIPDWFEKLTNLKGWGPSLINTVKSGGHAIREWINDKIPGPGPLPDFGGIFDSGGPLYPGSTFAVNNTGKVETVFTHDQMVDVTGNLAHIARGLAAMLTDAHHTTGTGSSALVDKLTLVGRPEEMPGMLRDATHQLRLIRLGGVHAARTP